MSVVPASRPLSDPEWVRSVEQRLRQLQTSPTLRAGTWVLQDVDGSLIASSSDGGQTLSLSGTTDVETPSGPVRGFVTAAEAEEITNTGFQGLLDAIQGGDAQGVIAALGGLLGGGLNSTNGFNQVLDILGGAVVTPINSAVQSVKDWFVGLTGKTSALSTTGKVDAAALTNIGNIPDVPIKGALGDFAQAAVDAVRNGLAGGLSLLTGATPQQLQNQTLATAQLVQSALATITALQTNNAAGLSEVASGGLNKIIVPKGADGAALNPAQFSAGGPNAGDVVMRANNYMGIAADRPVGIYHETVAGTFTTEQQAVEIVLGDQGAWEGATTFVFFHSDTGNTAGVYAGVNKLGVVYGLYTRSGGSYSLAPFTNGTYSAALAGGTRVRVRNITTEAGVTTYYVDTNGNQVFEVTNNSATFNATRRSAHIGYQRAFSNGFFGWGAQNFDSFRVASVIATDYVPGAVAGSGGEFVRTQTNAINVANSAGSFPMPNGYWTTARNVSADVLFDLATGTWTFTKATRYHIDIRIKGTAFTFAQSFWYIRLFRGGVADKQLGASMIGGDNSSNGPYLAASTIITVKAGDTLQAGYDRTNAQLGGSSSVTGAVNEVWFAIAEVA